MGTKKIQLVIAPSYVSWRDGPRRKATSREWDLIRAALQLGHVKWQDGFVHFESWRSRLQETSYIRQFQRVVAQVPRVLQSNLGIKGVGLEHPDRDQSRWRLGRANNPLYDSNLGEAARLAREGRESFEVGAFDEGWDQVRQSYDLYPCPRILCPIIAAASTAPATLMCDRQWVTQLLVSIQQHAQILTSAICKVSSLAAAKRDDITPDNAGDALEQWVVELLKARMALALLLSAGSTAKTGTVEPVEEFLRLTNAYRRARAAADAPSEATPEAILQRLRDSDFVVDVINAVSIYVEEIRHWRLNAHDVARTANSAIDSFLMLDPTPLPNTTLYARFFSHLLQATKDDRKGRQALRDTPDNSLERKRCQLDELIRVYDTTDSAIASVGYIAESIMKDTPAQSSLKRPIRQTRGQHKRPRKSNESSQSILEGMDKVRQWVLGHPSHGKLEILGRPIADWQLYQDLPLLQEIKQENLPREQSGTKTGEHDWHTFHLDRWEEEVLRERRTCVPPVTVDQLFAEFSSVVQRAHGGESEAVSAVPRFVVLGPPGCGKSTFCRWLQWRAAEGRLHPPGRLLLPAYVRLLDWSRTGGQLPEFLAGQSEMQSRPTPDHWREWLQGGDVLLLLDGLDEVEAQSPVSAWVQDVLGTYQACPVLLTCRTVSRERHQEVCPDFPAFLLAGLEKPQRDAYIEHFPARRFDHRALIEQLDRTPAIEPLAANPLLLSIICYVFEDGLRLPAPRGELYEAAVTRLLKRSLRDTAHESGLALSERKRILQQAAFRLFLVNGAQRRLIFDEEELLKETVAAVCAVRTEDCAHDVARLLKEDLLDRGILTGHEERGFAFLHPTIQEFLTASEIARQIEEKGWEGPLKLNGKPVTLRRLVDAKAWDPNWQEVIAMLAGRLSNPAPLLEMLSNPEPTPTNPHGDDVFRHRLGLAGQCLPDISIATAATTHLLIAQITTDVLKIWWDHGREGTDWLTYHLAKAMKGLSTHNGAVRVSRLRGSDLYDVLCSCLGPDRQDRDLSDCLSVSLSDVRTHVQRTSAVVIANVGAEIATPEIVERLVDLLSSEDIDVQAASAWALGILRPTSVSPRLVEGLVETLCIPFLGVWDVAAWTIGRLGCDSELPGLLDELVGLLELRDVTIAESAGCAVRNLTPAVQRRFVEHLSEMLRNDDREVRYIAMRALREVGAAAGIPPILNALIGMISSEQGLQREVSTTMCSIFRFRSLSMLAVKRVLDQLLEVLHRADPDGQEAAINAIAGLGPGATDPRLAKRISVMLGSEHKRLRSAALRCLGGIGPEGVSTGVLDQIGEILRWDEWQVRREAAEAVARLGPVAARSKTMTELATIMAGGNKDSYLRTAALHAVICMGRSAATPSFLDTLASLWEHSTPEVRAVSLQAACGLGAAAADARLLKLLPTLLQDEDFRVRASAAEVLVFCDLVHTQPVASDQFTEILGDRDGFVRMKALNAVCGLDPPRVGRRLLNQVLKGLSDEDRRVSSAAVEAVGHLGPFAARPEVMEQLISMRKEQEPVGRWTGGYTEAFAYAIEAISREYRYFKNSDGYVMQRLWNLSTC